MVLVASPRSRSPRMGTPSEHKAARIARQAAPTLKLAALHFDASRAGLQDGSWRQQTLVKARDSPRLKAIEPRAASTSEAVAALAGKSDADLVQMLLDNDLNTTTFIEYLRSQGGSPSTLMPWLHTLSALVSKIGMLLESTRYLTSDLQLARILHHIQISARALVGAKRARAWLVNAQSDAVHSVGERGEVLLGGEPAERLSTGTSFAAHCARSAKPLLIGLPGSPHRAGLHYNVDSGTGLRPESCLCVPCLDHVGNVLAVIQVIDKDGGGRAFGRDDLVLLQRFAIQCGISLRNAGSTSFSSAAPRGATLKQCHMPRRGAGPPSSQAAAGGAALDDSPRTASLAPPPPRSPREGGGRAPRPSQSRPRTSDASCQCELIR
jgi:hypothetical protein